MQTKVFLKRVKRKIKRTFGKPVNYYKAVRFFNAIKEEKKENETIIILTPLIGDTVYALSCLEGLKSSDPTRKIHVFGYSKWERLYSSYPQIDEITYVDAPEGKSYKDMDSFIGMNYLSEKARKQGIINANPFYYKRCYKDINPDIMYQIKTYIYGVGENAEITYHGFAGKARQDTHDTGKKAILNPYSYSAYEASFELYERIAEYLKKAGHAVYTNVTADQKPIQGTEVLKCTIYELFEVAQKSEIIVSTRSGILDYLAPSNIHMFVVYENCSERIKRMYHLNNWKCRGLIKEVYISDSGYNYDEVFEEFCGFMSSFSENEI